LRLRDPSLEADREQRRAGSGIAAVDAVLDFGKQLTRDHQHRMPAPSYDSAKAVILTLFAAAHRAGGAAADLLRRGWADEAQVIGRSVFEHVVYAYLISQDDRQRLLFVHYGPSLGRWDEVDAFPRVFDADEALVAAARSKAHQAGLRAVEALDLVSGETEQDRRADLKSLAGDPEMLYARLNTAYPKHRRGRMRAWCSKNLYNVTREVDDKRGSPTFLALYQVLYVNASRVAYSDPSTVGLVRADNPATLLMVPDPTMTDAAASAIGQLLLGIDELVNDVFQLGLDEALTDAAAAFEASLSSR
jgi:Family of unknown function (DUF5677)